VSSAFGSCACCCCRLWLSSQRVSFPQSKPAAYAPHHDSGISSRLRGAHGLHLPAMKIPAQSVTGCQDGIMTAAWYKASSMMSVSIIIPCNTIMGTAGLSCTAWAGVATAVEQQQWSNFRTHQDTPVVASATMAPRHASIAQRPWISSHSRKRCRPNTSL